MDAHRREALAKKGRALYAKFCDGDSCALSFALYHRGRGEAEVVDDLAAFLETQVMALEADDPEGRLGATKALLSACAVVQAGVDGWRFRFDARGLC